MKTKSKILISALVVIALCVSLIAGTTFALFSSEDNVNITVSSGKVSVKATVGEITKSTSIDGKEPVVEATVVGGKVTLDKMVPGDRVSFPISVSNEGTTVKAAYSVAYEVTDGYLLADGLDIKIEYVNEENATVDITNGGSYKSYSSAWNDDVASVYNVTIELPNHADSKIDNLYQGLSTSINFAVNAVQANGVTIGGEAVTENLPDYSDVKDLAAKEDIAVAYSTADLEKALESEKHIILEDDIELTKKVASLDNVEIDARGHEIILNTGNITSIDGQNVVIRNAVFTDKCALWGVCSSGVSYYNCTFDSVAPYIDGAGDVVIDGCTIKNTTLQFGERKIFSNVKITNNVFYCNNVDNGSHAIVLNGETDAYWNSGAQGLVFEGNTFNAINEGQRYIAYYIVSNGNIKNVPVYNNTYNGEAYYAINSTALDNQKSLANFDNELKVGVTVKGINGSDGVEYASLQEAYAALNPVVAEHGLGQEAITDKNVFNSLYTDGGKITWTIYGEQTVDNALLFSLGRKASYYSDECNITNISIIGGNNNAKLILNTGVTLPYQWWGEAIPSVELVVENVTLEQGKADNISFAPYGGFDYVTKHTFSNCNIIGWVYSYFNGLTDTVFDNCAFTAKGEQKYALHVQGRNADHENKAIGTVVINNCSFDGYTRGINLDSNFTNFTVSNSTFSNISAADCGAIQITRGNSYKIEGNIFKKSVKSSAIRIHETIFDGEAEITINDNVIESLYLINGYKEGYKITSSGNKVIPTKYMEKDTKEIKDSPITLG